jgi:hypothetical protein
VSMEAADQRSVFKKKRGDRPRATSWHLRQH